MLDISKLNAYCDIGYYSAKKLETNIIYWSANISTRKFLIIIYLQPGFEFNSKKSFSMEGCH